MRGVGDRCPASPKHFWGFDNSTLFWLTKGKIWQLVTNRQLIFHEFCSEASSKIEAYGNVAKMVQRSLCMRGVRGSTPRISKTFLRLRQFYLVLADNGKDVATRYKSKADLSWILLTSYLKAWKVRERSSIGRALVSHARGTVIDAPHLQNIFEDSTILSASGWQNERIDNWLQIESWSIMNFVHKLSRSLKSTGM